MANPAVRVCALLDKDALRKSEEFQRSWSEQLSTSSGVFGEIVKHTQFRSDGPTTEKFAEMGYPMENYGGAASIYTEDLESMKEFLSRCIGPASEKEELKADAQTEIPLIDYKTPIIVGYDLVVIDKTHKVPAGKRLAKFVGMVYKNPSMKAEEMHEYWSHEHAQLFTSLPLVQEKVIKYTQFHSSPQWTEELRKMGFNVTGFDGVAEIHVEEADDFIAVFESQPYLEKVHPDEIKLFDFHAGAVMLGYEEVVFDRCQPVANEGPWLIHTITSVHHNHRSRTSPDL